VVNECNMCHSYVLILDRRGIVHRDLKAANLLIDEYEVRLRLLCVQSKITKLAQIQQAVRLYH